MEVKDLIAELLCHEMRSTVRFVLSGEGVEIEVNSFSGDSTDLYIFLEKSETAPQ